MKQVSLLKKNYFTLLNSLLFLLFFTIHVNAQTVSNVKGNTVKISLSDFQTKSANSVLANGLIGNFKTQFPNQLGVLTDYTFNEELISTQKISGITTLAGKSDDGKIIMKLTVTANGFEGIMKAPEGYYFIEPSNKNADEYIVYSMSETDVSKIKCDIGDNFDLKKNEGNGTNINTPPFPVGTDLRIYRLAAAATGEFVSYYGGQATALTKIVSVINAANLIYELETSIRFQLITATTNYTILFTNAATDPFSPDPSFANADASQTGFNTMNSNGTLPYANYDVGHTFNVYTIYDQNGNPVNSISSRGQAGPDPCTNTKARGWTEWSTTPTVLPTYLSMVVSVYVHEVGHQFTAWHTFNALGGTDVSNPTFCSGGWSNTDAIEPGSGTTLMSYANNCVYPTNYTITGNNKLSYFNTKSLEKIYNYVSNSATCFTTTATGNTPPTAEAGTNITIPKGTPFKLVGTASDANGDAMSYTWEQYDVATSNDAGALGSSITGTGGYSAVNSTTAPLFRSEQSNSSLERTFPKLTYILNNANNPADNEGEDLPQVARTMKFRFTVRDNKANGGGVDSDEIAVTVSSAGPLQVAAPNGGESWAANSSQTVTWNVNSTNSLTTNVNILLSVDGGITFPYTLATNTPNDGTQSVNLPNTPASSKARIKVVGVISSFAEFFDITDANFTITSTCIAYFSQLCETTDINTTLGSSTLNLQLSPAAYLGNAITTKSVTITSTNIPFIGYTDNTRTVCTPLIPNASTAKITFRVSTAGLYTISKSSGFAMMSIHNNTQTPACSNFVGGTGYQFGAGYGAYSPLYVTLSPCVDYTFYIATSGTFTITFSGPGNVQEILSMPSGIAYTYVAISNADNLIKTVSATADFTNLAIGSYKVYGMSYDNTLIPSTFVGQSLSALMSGTSCLYPSDNYRNITVNCVSPPAAPTATGGNRCGTGTVNLSASGCAGTYNWYAASSGGASLAATAAFTTPSISTTTTYYVDCTVSGCTSTRSSAIATVNSTPAAPTGVAGNRCGTGTVNLSATGCAGTYNWYAASTGGSSLAATAAFTTPSISTTTTYYVDCTVSGCVSATRNSAIATINATPTAPTGVAGNRCGTGTVSLSATGCAGTYNWYAASTGGSSLAATAAFTTPSISTTTTYYVDCTVSGCVSATRNSAIATVNATPAAPTGVAGNRCGTGTVNLSATGCAGTYNWYAASSGGASLAATAAFTTPSISTTTTYYVDCTVSGCVSATRSSAIATVNATPTAPTGVAGNRCGTGTVNLSASGCAGTYNWYAASTGGSSLGTGASFGTPSITTTTTYYVDCTVGTCVSATRSSAVATVNTANPPTVSNANCVTSPTTVTASGCAGTYNWYLAPTGGVWIGGDATSPVITGSGTYYVDCTVGSCVSNRSAVTITIKPAAPTGVAGSRCGTGSVSLSASGCAGTYNWYAASTGGSSLGTGASFGTPSITTTTTYYVDCTVGTCVSTTRSSAEATVNTTIPAAPTVNSVTINSGATATLTASGCAGTVNWFSAASGGSSLGTGTTYTTVALSNPPNATYTYYADCTVSTCTSATRGSGVVTVNTSPCPSMSYNLVSPGNDVSSGTSKWEAGLQITATNKITGSSNVKYDSGKYVLLNPGFKAEAGTVFTAYIDGCGNN